MISFCKHIIGKLFCVEKIYKLAFLFILLVVVTFSFCTSGLKTKSEIKIGFSQCTSNDEWRLLMNREIIRECQLAIDNNIELIFKDAQNNSTKQIADIEELINSQVDIIIVSPKEAKPLASIIAEAFDKGIPVIVVDRKIDSENFTAFVGADNLYIGKEAGKYAAQLLKDKGRILEISGLEGSTPAMERAKGFRDAIKNYDSLIITHSVSGQWYEDYGEKICDSIFAFDRNIDLIYCHNDFMARGAYNACVKNRFFPKIIGIDGLATPNGGINMVIEGKMEATFLYPSGGEKAVQVALDILNGRPFSRYNDLYTVRIDKLNARAVLFQEQQVQVQFEKIDQQQLLIGRMKTILHKQSVFLTLSILIIVLALIVAILILVLLKNKNKTNALLMERNQVIENQNEEIIVQRDNLKSLNATKDKLFGIISHDLINPFNVIIGFSDQMKTDARNSSIEEIEDQAAAIHKASTSAYNLLNNLLHWARSQQNQIKFNPEPVSVSEIVESEVKLLRGQADAKGIIIKAEVKKKEIIADKNLLSIVIRNLISNAIKFSNPGNTIYIASNFTEEEIVFSVKDEGVGLSETQIENLFRLKTNSSTWGTKGERGTGLGLLLCKDYVEKHNGKLWVESQVNKGSTFYFSIKQS